MQAACQCSSRVAMAQQVSNASRGGKRTRGSDEAVGNAVKRRKGGPAIRVSLESLTRFAQSMAAEQQQYPAQSAPGTGTGTAAGQRALLARDSLLLVKDVVEQLTCKLIHASAGIALGRAPRAAQPRHKVRPCASSAMGEDPPPGHEGAVARAVAISDIHVDEAAARMGLDLEIPSMHAVNAAGTVSGPVAGAEEMARGGSVCTSAVEAAPGTISVTQTVAEAGAAAGLEAGAEARARPKASVSAPSSRPFQSVRCALRDGALHPMLVADQKGHCDQGADHLGSSASFVRVKEKRRPRGRTPKGKKWDYEKMEWADK